jgi:hypothetical protein
MDIIKELAQSGRKILTDTKQQKNTLNVSKPVKAKIEEPITDIHQAFVKKAIKDKPKKQEVVEFFQRVCEAEERKL